MHDEFNETAEWLEALASLKAEHRDLDAAIDLLSDTPTRDQLMLRRLKKRKLALKDRIAYIEAMLDPPEPA